MFAAETALKYCHVNIYLYLVKNIQECHVSLEDIKHAVMLQRFDILEMIRRKYCQYDETETDDDKVFIGEELTTGFDQACICKNIDIIEWFLKNEDVYMYLKPQLIKTRFNHKRWYGDILSGYKEVVDI
jgi:hypothetical protein